MSEFNQGRVCVYCKQAVTGEGTGSNVCDKCNALWSKGEDIAFLHPFSVDFGNKETVISVEEQKERDALIAKQKYEIEKLKEDIDSKQKQIDNQKYTIEKLNRGVDSRQSRINKLVTDIKILNEEVGLKQSQIDRQSGSINELNSAVDIQKRTIEGQRVEIDEQKKTIEEQRVEIETKEKVIKERRSIIDKIWNVIEKVDIYACDYIDIFMYIGFAFLYFLAFVGIAFGIMPLFLFIPALIVICVYCTYIITKDMDGERLYVPRFLRDGFYFIDLFFVYEYIKIKYWVGVVLSFIYVFGVINGHDVDHIVWYIVLGVALFGIISDIPVIIFGKHPSGTSSLTGLISIWFIYSFSGNYKNIYLFMSAVVMFVFGLAIASYFDSPFGGIDWEILRNRFLGIMVILFAAGCLNSDIGIAIATGEIRVLVPILVPVVIICVLYFILRYSFAKIISLRRKRMGVIKNVDNRIGVCVGIFALAVILISISFLSTFYKMVDIYKAMQVLDLSSFGVLEFIFFALGIVLAFVVTVLLSRQENGEEVDKLLDIIRSTIMCKAVFDVIVLVIVIKTIDSEFVLNQMINSTLGVVFLTSWIISGCIGLILGLSEQYRVIGYTNECWNEWFERKECK